MADFKAGNPVLIKNVIQDYMIYTLEGTGILSPYIRKYSDFLLLQNVLRRDHPGILLPVLPSEQPNDQTDYINYFIKKLLELKTLFNDSKAIHIFFTQSENIEPILKIIPPESLEDIADKYERWFKDSIDKNFTFELEESATKVQKYLQQIDEIYLSMQRLNQSLEQAKKDYALEYTGWFSFLKVLTFHEIATTSKFVNEDPNYLVLDHCKEKLQRTIDEAKNPFDNVTSSTKSEEMDALAIKEAVESYQNLMKIYFEKRGMLEAIQQRMKQMVESKSNWLSYLSLQTPEEEFAELTSNKALLDIDLKSIQKIIKFSFWRLEEYFKVFVESKKKEYFKKLNAISSTAIENIRLQEEFWKEVEERGEKISEICGKI